MDTGAPILSFFRTAARGLEAQRRALSTATENIANANTTRTPDGGSYAIKRALHSVGGDKQGGFRDMMSNMQTQMATPRGRHMSGLQRSESLDRGDFGPTTEIVEEIRTRMEFDPEHPHADAGGYVHYPDINVVEEMARMVSANRLYEANLSSVQAAKEIIKRTLEI